MKKEITQARGNGKNNKYKEFTGGFTYVDTDKIEKIKKMKKDMEENIPLLYPSGEELFNSVNAIKKCLNNLYGINDINNILYTNSMQHLEKYKTIKTILNCGTICIGNLLKIKEPHRLECYIKVVEIFVVKESLVREKGCYFTGEVLNQSGSQLVTFKFDDIIKEETDV